MEGISIKIPEKVFFSNAPGKYIVKNDFYITIYKSLCGEEHGERGKKRGGEMYPAIYIKGFEQLFKDNGTQEIQLEAFFKMFHSNGNMDWSISYGRFRDTEERCAVITTAADFLAPDFTVGFHLSDKCIFTEIPDTEKPLTLQIYVDDFDYFFPDLSDRMQYQISLERGFAVYIERFGAYTEADLFHPVNAVHKGDSAYISWEIQENEKASAFLYDEHGALAANLPPYFTKIDKDRKFTLTAYNDFCSVTEELYVYRTLWKQRIGAKGFPQTDEFGRCKFYKSYEGDYFLYVHPVLYTSQDLETWNIYSPNMCSPSKFNFYSSSFSEQKFCVCYVSTDRVTYCEMDFEEKVWKKYEEFTEGIISAHVLLSEGEPPVSVLASREDIGFFEVIGGKWMNGRYLKKPKGAKIKALDVLSYGARGCAAVLYDTGRVFFYDLEDDYKNNIFECPNVKDDNIYLIKTNAIYILLSGYMFEISDREKFTDTHFFPEFKAGTYPIAGPEDDQMIVAAFQTEEGVSVWEYQF
ncbi:Uncharacterised protein [uncultured Roseburia sp.]|uniref:Uncharacterized protein n=1 Tax=Brotonthovivens ammoniilytica TaxID=2981725 RepID=A0ABT2TG92_9FIRM|nr:hypothetical protein [Brotonthovivens ammoniilytica]MCU6761190.1 hypothetical protein [Brotonthovivens ammoniilytica]SCI21476.1 Uncharacterised protein [uncultured Roseburia sp.]